MANIVSCRFRRKQRHTICAKFKTEFKKHYDRLSSLTAWGLGKFLLEMSYLVILIEVRVFLPGFKETYGFYTEETKKAMNMVLFTCTTQIFTFVSYMLVNYLPRRSLLDVLFGIVMTVSTWASVDSLMKIRIRNIESPLQILSILQTHFRHKKNFPVWLHRAQLKEKCCGVFDFRDYRAFIYDFRGQKNKSFSIKEDVPFSCCHSPVQGRRGVCYNQNRDEDAGKIPLNQGNCFAQPDSTYNEGIVEIFKSSKNLQISSSRLNETSVYNSIDFYSADDDDGDTQLLVNPAKVGNYHTEGCYNTLYQQTTTLYSTFLCFILGILAISLFCMMVVYTRSKHDCGKNRGILKYKKHISEYNNNNRINYKTDESETSSTSTSEDDLSDQNSPKSVTFVNKKPKKIVRHNKEKRKRH